MEEWFQALNWTNDLDVEAARKRGLVRLRIGAALLIIIGIHRCYYCLRLFGVCCFCGKPLWRVH